MRSTATYHAHRKACTYTHPPGRRVYQRGAHILWEVDGAQAKLYVQNLCLFGKLFIDHKTVFFDVAPFVVYVLTDATSQFDHALGFFSKEKVSYDDFNLACIVVFPPYQRKGYGTLLMEYSYYLSRSAAVAGTPERPLSELGLKGYMAFWSAQLVRTLQAAWEPGGDAIRAVLAGDAAAVAPVVAVRRRTAARGWAGEVRVERMVVSEDTVPLPPRTTLARLAAAAGLRPDDATLALAQAGLLVADDGTLTLSREAVRAAAARLRVRPPILDEAYCI
ncbi:histone acetyltransferase [Malassezia equina]|uniref:histone acetyltransferase n=1 Tax=Malassezia equina TaxID=1381935 RepID=A0AAF0J028_9BASI|nr:histone acetyltransferase [Malassezia equina]